MMDWLWKLDQELFYKIHVAFHNEWLRLLNKWISNSALGYVSGIILIALLFKEKTKRYSLICIGSLLLLGVTRPFVMRYADRMRPSNFDYANPFECFYGNNSFPSGHTGTAFTLAVILFLLTRHGAYRKLGIWALVWALLVAFSRVYGGVHYPTDVIAGACYGAMCSCIVYLVVKAKGDLPSQN